MNTTHESIYAHYVGWLNTHDVTPRTRTYKCRQILRYLEFLEDLNVSAPLVSSSHIQAYMQVFGQAEPAYLQLSSTESQTILALSDRTL